MEFTFDLNKYDPKSGDDFPETKVVLNLSGKHKGRISVQIGEKKYFLRMNEAVLLSKILLTYFGVNI